MECLALLKAIRRQYAGRIWIVLDNLSAHKTAAIRKDLIVHALKDDWVSERN